MSWRLGWRSYVPAAERRAQAARQMTRMEKKLGPASPVLLEGRKIASTFWGKAWCDNLEAYSDFANRLPRGRTYVRNGSVVDLQISQGKVVARVAGSSLYKIEIGIQPLEASLWKSIQTHCAGKIDSLIELLQGKLSSSVMEIVTRPQEGLFPAPQEIKLGCSCPDWADLCKHVAASLYGVGARLDQNPGLLFLLRGVDPSDLINKASATEAVRQTVAGDGVPVLTDKELTDVFGIELAEAQAAPKVSEAVMPPAQIPISLSNQTPDPKPPKKASRRINSAARPRLAALARARKKKANERAGGRPPAGRKLSATAKARIAAAMKR